MLVTSLWPLQCLCLWRAHRRFIKSHTFHSVPAIGQCKTVRADTLVLVTSLCMAALMFMPVESTQEIYKKPHLSFTDSALIAIVIQLNAHPHFPQGVSRCCIQRVHTECQRQLSDVHSIVMENSAQAGEGGGGGLHAHSLSQYQPSRTKLWCTLLLRGQIYTHPIFLLYLCMYSEAALFFVYTPLSEVDQKKALCSNICISHTINHIITNKP